METAERLTSFFTIAAKDQRLLTSHVCIYAAMCSIGIVTGSAYTISINRRGVMQACKILSNATYHKCMRELHEFGYINYVPSYHPILGSLVTFNDFVSLLNA